jgi:hypothetical protein
MCRLTLPRVCGTTTPPSLTIMLRRQDVIRAAEVYLDCFVITTRDEFCYLCRFLTRSSSSQTYESNAQPRSSLIATKNYNTFETYNERKATNLK